ncbi:MAG: hypothetical protein HC825_01455 [Oscillatoriales cyanobacterium RM1_1_9]|nr:hypothetical protein [Oscillatoriales cyanobacterium RM1_1_9]
MSEEEKAIAADIGAPARARKPTPQHERSSPMPPPGFDITWWISVIEIPLLAALFKLMWDIKKDLSAKIEQMDLRHAESTGRLRDDLAGHRPAAWPLRAHTLSFHPYRAANLSAVRPPLEVAGSRGGRTIDRPRTSP